MLLSRPGFFDGTTLWDTTARFHVWPWPYKFAAVSNMPALFAGVLLSVPIGAVKPTLPESVQLAPTVLFVLILWSWVGSRLDRRWTVTEKTPWIGLSVFTVVCLVGALIPIGYTGYVFYGVLAWLITAIPFRRMVKATRPPSS
ncbi:MAG TPA: hypothetical protein VN948_19210 [Terriglobales bacterium]|nr:hypothetical protein [Terriglobales bacterium]